MRRALRAAPPLPEPAVAAAAAAAAAAVAVAAAVAADAVADAHLGPPAAAPAVEGAAAFGSKAPRGCADLHYGGCGDPAPSAALDGWSIVDDDCLGARLRWLRGAARHGGAAGDGGGMGHVGRGEAAAEVGVPPPSPLPLLQLHESGAPLQSALHGVAGAGAAGAAGAAGVSLGCVLLFGDHVGYTPDEEAAVLAAGGVRCALGHVPLLTSQCMVIAHFLLDAANSGLGPGATVERE